MKKTSVSASRIAIFDVLRIVLTILVVNLHSEFGAHAHSNLLTDYGWYAVPLFLVLSFFLTSKYFMRGREPIKTLWVRIKRLCIPLIFWSAVGFIVHPQRITGTNIVLQLLTGGVVNVPLYFLILMICYTAVFWGLTYLPKSIRIAVYVLIIGLAFQLENSGLNFLWFTHFSEAVKNCYGRFFELIPYASLGILFGYLNGQLRKNLLIPSFIMLAALLIYSRVHTALPPWGFSYGGMKYFAGTILVFMVLLLVTSIRLHPTAQQAIHTLGKYSFGVYLLHYILFESLLIQLPALRFVVISFPLLFLGLYVAFCYCLCILVNGLFRNKLGFLFT